MALALTVVIINLSTLVIIPLQGRQGGGGGGGGGGGTSMFFLSEVEVGHLLLLTKLAS